METSVRLSWKWLVGQGLIVLLLGVAAIFFPAGTAVAFAFLWGTWALIDSATSFASAFARDVPVWARVLGIVIGVVALLAAVFALMRPFYTLGILTWLLGIWLVARGIVELVSVFRPNPWTARLLIAASAILDLVLGVLFFLNPGRGVVSLIIVFGVLAMIWGITTLAAGFVLRSQGKKIHDDAPAAGSIPTSGTSDEVGEPVGRHAAPATSDVAGAAVTEPDATAPDITGPDLPGATPQPDVR